MSQFGLETRCCAISRPTVRVKFGSLIRAASDETDRHQIGEGSSGSASREESSYWVILGQNPPEIAYWERGEWG
jgi:hypothetical protein